MTFDFRYPTPLPSTKGWGPGWPNCQRDVIVPVAPFVGGLNKGIADLMGLLAVEMDSRGLDFMEPGCWGFGCRGTKASSGSGTGTPSFHSWGLGLDINAPRNVFGAAESTSEIATTKRWVVPLMTSYGFFWLGPPIKDWMHFSFCGSPQDAKDMTEKARRELGDMAGVEDIMQGAQDFRDDKQLNDTWTPARKFGYNNEKRHATAGPKGDPGAKGDKGDPGAKGDKGDPGTGDPLHDHNDRYATVKHPHIVPE